MLCPKRTRYRKYQKGKGRLQNIYKSSDILQFGRYGIKVKNSGYLKSNTIEAVRRNISRTIKRNGWLWIRVFPNFVKSQKPLSTRMGKGKGSPSFWYVRVYAGQILFEMDGIPASLAEQAFLEASQKIPLKVSFIKI